MSHQSSLPDRLSHALASPNQGVIGLVDELLALSSENDLRFDWQAGRFQVDFQDGDRTGRIDVPLPRSVVRAALARIASLCNERKPNSVSPYGGQGEIVVDASPAKAIQVAFVNTPEKLSLELASVRLGGNLRAGEQSLSTMVDENDHPSNEAVRNANHPQASVAPAQSPVVQAAVQLKHKKIWRFLSRAAAVNATEYSLAELGTMIGLSTSKVCSLKAILAKPEQRLGVQFFEPAPSGAVDATGSPKYRMPEVVRQAVLNA